MVTSRIGGDRYRKLIVSKRLDVISRRLLIIINHFEVPLTEYSLNNHVAKDSRTFGHLHTIT